MEIRSDNFDQLSGLAEMLAQQVMTKLLDDYPAYGNGWAVVVNQRGGMIHIMNMLISAKMGFSIKMSSLVNDPQLLAVMRGAGEYLERFNQSRSRVVNIENSLSDMKRDFKYEPVAEV